MIAQGNDMLLYIPQRPPVVMVDSLIEATETKIISGLTINSSNIFVTYNKLSESGLVENIAQTAAAGIGYKQVVEKAPVNLGYIAAIKSLQIHFLPNVGEQLFTTVEVVNNVMDITIVMGKVMVNNNIAAECEMRIFTKNLSI
jgi:3-hydroxymyristoyl/3-hydroxydecanoyl-(acyl carrier protein) dehydratase